MARSKKIVLCRKPLIWTVLLAALLLVLFASPASAMAYGNAEVNLTWDTVNGWNYEPLAPVTVTVKDHKGDLKGSATTTVGTDGRYYIEPYDFSSNGSFDIKSGDTVLIEVGGTAPVTETITPNLSAFTSATHDAIHITSNHDRNIKIDIDRYKDGSHAVVETQTASNGTFTFDAGYDILPADYFYISYQEDNGNKVGIDATAPYAMAGIAEDTVWGYYYQPQTPVTIDVYSGSDKLGSASATTDSDGYFRAAGFASEVDIKNGYTMTISSGDEVDTFKANLKADVDFIAGTITGRTAPGSYMVARSSAPGAKAYVESTATADRNGVFSIKANPGLSDNITVSSLHPSGNVTRLKVLYGTQTQSTGQPTIYGDHISQAAAIIKTQEIRPQSLTTATASNEVTLKIVTNGVRFSSNPQALPLGVKLIQPVASLSEDSKTAVWYVSDASTSTAGKILFTDVYYDVDTGTAEGPVEVEVAGSSGVTTETVTNASIQTIKGVFEISGRITDDTTSGIEGAKIHLFSNGSPMTEIRTSPDGSYGFPGLNAGAYKIVVTKLGYTVSQFETDLASDIVDRNFILKKTDIGLIKPEENGVQGFEQIEDILDNLGYPDVSIVTTDDLTNVQELKANLHCLFIDSSPLTYNAAQVSAINDFVNNGGSLYASDMSYFLISQAFPGRIAFGAEGVTTPQVVASTIKNSGLADYLNPSEPATSLAVGFNEFMTPWITIDSVASGCDIFTSGNIAAGNTTLVDRPLAVGFRWGKGRVVYSSYYCSPDRGNDGGDGLLRYLVLNTLVGAEINNVRDALAAGGYSAAKINIGLTGASDTPPVYGFDIASGKDVAVDLWWRTGPFKLSVLQSGTIKEATATVPPAGVTWQDVPAGLLKYSARVIGDQADKYPYVIAVGTKATTPPSGGGGTGGGGTGGGGSGSGGTGGSGGSGGGGSSGSGGQDATDDSGTHMTINGYPKNLMANQGKGYVSLNWSGVSDPDVTGYNIYRIDGKSGVGIKLNDSPIAVTFFKDKSIDFNKTYYYWVTAANNDGDESEPSEIVTMTTTAVLGEIAFADVPVNAWYKSYILKLTAAGVIDGYSDGSFKPQNNVTRAEFCKLILASLDEKPLNGSTSSFGDISGHWAKGYIEKAKQLGIIDGYGEGTFRPDARVTRAEISKMICSAKGMAISETMSGFYDCNSCWADKYISSLKTTGILAGYSDGTFRPQNSATRAEVCKIIALMMEGEQ